ncbi:hypothetical protein HJG60_009037 [Phyllostomus discolor]|uniref:Uncharacterized protein n=1 Tax=Phyllostomus discolor TaxID=89673 RepID=A0A833YRQ1_9CHIR|nr:hypothetical protein HJG60_009037 [Phyllostomus discolor]
MHTQPSAHHPRTNSLSGTEKCRSPMNLLYHLSPSCKTTKPGDNWTWGTSLSLPPAPGSLQFTLPTVHPLCAWHSAGDMAMTHMSLLSQGAQCTAGTQARQDARLGGWVVTCKGEDSVARPPEEAGGPSWVNEASGRKECEQTDVGTREGPAAGGWWVGALTPLA